MQAQRSRIRGITLIELMITLVVLAVLVSVAMPAFGSLIGATNVRNARSSLSASLAEARITAVTKSRHVVVCPSLDQLTCTGDIHWENGWIVFLDGNRDAQRQADEIVTSVAQPQGAGTTIISTRGRTRAVYRPDGSATGTNLTLTFCDAKASTPPSVLVINNAGRVRSGKASAAQAAACAAAG